MRTAIDSNIISALWSKEALAPKIAKILGDAKLEGGLVVSAPVYAELVAHPKSSLEFVDKFLSDTGIAVEFEIEARAWMEAGLRYARYAARRRRSARDTPKRLLADFIIGCHALMQADRLMTLDARRYQRDFPELKITSVS
jgi:predicted nucleic acid-binding protein